VFAGRAAARSGRTVPEIHWAAGLSAWRVGQIRLAAWHFSSLANADAELVLPAERARAAFWAARAYLVDRRPQLVSQYLRMAAAGRDFYGLLARAVLAQPLTGDAEQIALGQGMVQVLLDIRARAAPSRSARSARRRRPSGRSASWPPAPRPS
jgi:hypothetical protein